MNRYFIKVENEKITERVIRPNDEYCETLLADGYIEITEEQYASMEIFTDYIYKNGKIAIDTKEEERKAKDTELRAEYDNLALSLANTDYVVIKIAEGVATEKDYADVLKDRAEWRKRINEIEKEIGNGGNRI